MNPLNNDDSSGAPRGPYLAPTPTQIDAMTTEELRVLLETHAALVAALEEIENRAKQMEGLTPTDIEAECLRVARTALNRLAP